MGKPKMNLALSLGLGGLILCTGFQVGFSATGDCPEGNSVSSEIDSLLMSRMDTAGNSTKLGFQIQFKYPTQQEMMRISDSCNRADVQCTGPDTVLKTYWETMGAKLLHDYELFASPSSGTDSGLKITDGSIAFASKATLQNISKECYVSLLRGYPMPGGGILGLHAPTERGLPLHRKGEVNALGRTQHGTHSPAQRYFPASHQR
jgi:hypothetical protein